MRDHSTKTTDVKCVLKMKSLKYFLNMLVTLNKQIKEFCELLGNQFNLEIPTLFCSPNLYHQVFR